MNRVLNHVKQTVFAGGYRNISSHDFLSSLSNALGERFDRTFASIDSDGLLEEYAGNDFHRALRVLEVLCQMQALQSEREKVSKFATDLLKNSEVSLGMRWRDGVFVKTGAEALDSALVNDPLKWLSKQELKTVREPFEKGLSHYLAASKNARLYGDVITDMYESVEALSKIITERPTRDLSGNAELFLKKIRASESYKKILKEYIAYANNFRHGGEKLAVEEHEAESFIYLTGLFIRMAIRED